MIHSWTDSGVRGLRGPCVHLTVTRHGLEHATIPHRYMTGEIAQALRCKHKAVTRTDVKWTDSGVHGLRGPCVHLTVTRHGLEHVTIPHRYMTGEIAKA
ncbi:hypothetical protein DPMN_179990 [Dreissena polymorpha]|uniref:Uncharacterized protein n=1 Tax=Dreissena polymorpha TaxID=45954 RepID=A0A9D4EH88_DREPO|nr:hypothetical protein DPMN_179990 [Dreissena polymorpha]